MLLVIIYGYIVISQLLAPVHCTVIFFTGNCKEQSAAVKCSQSCSTDGAPEEHFRCNCQDGYYLDEDGYTCLQALPPGLELDISIKQSLQEVIPVKEHEDSFMRSRRSTFFRQTDRGGTSKTGLSTKKNDRIQCQNNGIIMSHLSSTSYQYCLCPIGYGGSVCEKEQEPFVYPEFKLWGGFMKFTPREFSGLDFRITLDIKAKQSSGLILYHRSSLGIAFVLTLERSFLVFRFGSQDEYHEIRSRSPLDSKGKIIYRVEIKRRLAKGFLWINNGEVEDNVKSLTKKNDPNKQGELLIGDGFLYVGGHPSMAVLKKLDSRLVGSAETTFLGCITDLTVDGHKMDMRSTPFYGDVITAFGIDNCAGDVCSQNPCSNGGSCRVTSPRAYECRCPFGYKGTHCIETVKIKVPAFRKTSYLTYSVMKGSSSDTSDIQLTFKPMNASGLLFYQGYSTTRRGDFLSFSLVNGHVFVTFDLGSGSRELRSSTPVHLNQWHTIHFHRVGREGTFIVDGVKVSSGNVPGNQTQLTLTEDLYIGGHENYDQVSAAMNQREGFVGCVQSLVVNGQYIDLITKRKQAVNIHNCDGHPCAASPDVCDINGLCVSQMDSYTCSCKLGYTEAFCQSAIALESIQTLGLKGNGYMLFKNKEILDRLSGTVFNITIVTQMHKINSSKGSIVFYLKSEEGMKFREILLKIKGDYRLEVIVNDGFGADKFETLQQILPKTTTVLSLIRKSGAIYELQMNYSTVAVVRPKTEENIPIKALDNLFIGGADLSTAASLHMSYFGGFNGCFYSIEVDGNSITLNSITDGRNVHECETPSSND